MRNVFKGKKMWGYVSGTFVIPRNIDEGYAVLIDVCEANNLKIITLINNYVEHSIGIQLVNTRQQRRSGIICKGNLDNKFCKSISIRE